MTNAEGLSVHGVDLDARPLCRTKVRTFIYVYDYALIDCPLCLMALSLASSEATR